MEGQLTAYDNVRRRPSSLMERLQRHLLNTVMLPNTEIRGVAIAADTLVDAFLKHGSAFRYECVAYPYRDVDEVPPRSYEPRTTYGPSHSRIKSTVAHPKDSLRTEKFFAWLNLSPYHSQRGGIELSYKVRQKYSLQPYPITTLFHGFSVHRMRHDCFLRILLCRPLACDSLIATSRASARALRNIMTDIHDRFMEDFGVSLPRQERIDVIPLCVDTNYFHPMDKQVCRKALKLKRDAIILLHLGRISQLKADVLPLLSVLRELVRDSQRSELTLILAGSCDDAYAQTLRQVARETGLGERIKFSLSVSDDEKRQLIGASDIFLSLSDSVQESFGLAPVEAMAAGIPQIVSDWNGYKDTVDHGVTGFRVPTYWASADGDLKESGFLSGWEYDHLCLGQSVAVDVVKLREYLQILIDSPSRRFEMGVNSRQRALDLFDYQRVTQQYESLWNELAQIAQSTPLPAQRVTYDNSEYFATFGHYSSDVLGDNTSLQITDNGLLFKNAGGATSGFPVISPVIDGQLILMLLDLLSDANGNSDQTLVHSSETPGGKLINVLIDEVRSGSAIPTDRIRRHILWLVKYGLARL